MSTPSSGQPILLNPIAPVTEPAENLSDEPKLDAIDSPDARDGLKAVDSFDAATDAPPGDSNADVPMAAPVDGEDFVLVVDDSPTQLRSMVLALQSDGLAVRAAESAEAAVDIIAKNPPLLVVTDLEMPGMSGLQLTQTLRGTNPSLPVVLTTSRGSEDIAAEALRSGAASYIPKRLVCESLAIVVRQVLSTTDAVRSAKAVGRFATRSEIELRIDNDEALVPKVISRLEMTLVELDLFDEGVRMQIAMALDEALLNAIVHGNLEVPSSLREVDDGAAYNALIDQRRVTSPYSDRRVTVSLSATHSDGQGEAIFRIADEGPGYDVGALPSADDDEGLEGIGGRGMLMINAFMDTVTVNDRGNEIVMVKRA